MPTSQHFCVKFDQIEIAEMLQKLAFKSGYKWSTIGQKLEDLGGYSYLHFNYYYAGDIVKGSERYAEGYAPISLEEAIIKLKTPPLPPIKLGEYTAKITKGRCEVGCVTIDLATAKEILKRMEG